LHRTSRRENEASFTLKEEEYMEKKFPILHVVSAIFKILAWIVALGDILAIIALLTHKAGLPSMFQTANFTASPYVLALLALLFGVFYFILLYEIGRAHV
jgi:lysylphosphatidylglycerol synthetase-like protein (DUF2156 family)